MCDFLSIRNWFIATTIAIIAAASFVSGAAIANGSIFKVYLSPIGMLAAAGSTGLAILFISNANNALNVFSRCAGERCSGVVNNIRNIILAVKSVLGINLTACLTVAAYAWIPLAAIPAQTVIIGALLVLVPLVISGYVFINQLSGCQKNSVKSIITLSIFLQI